MGKCKYCEEGYGLKADGLDYSMLEIDGAERELECVLLFTISYCPVCGRKLW